MLAGSVAGSRGPETASLTSLAFPAHPQGGSNGWGWAGRVGSPSLMALAGVTPVWALVPLYMASLSVSCVFLQALPPHIDTLIRRITWTSLHGSWDPPRAKPDATRPQSLAPEVPEHHFCHILWPAQIIRGAQTWGVGKQTLDLVGKSSKDTLWRGVGTGRHVSFPGGHFQQPSMI